MAHGGLTLWRRSPAWPQKMILHATAYQSQAAGSHFLNPHSQSAACYCVDSEATQYPVCDIGPTLSLKCAVSLMRRRPLTRHLAPVWLSWAKRGWGTTTVGVTTPDEPMNKLVDLYFSSKKGPEPTVYLASSKEACTARSDWRIASHFTPDFPGAHRIGQ